MCKTARTGIPAVSQDKKAMIGVIIASKNAGQVPKVKEKRK